MRTVQWFVDRAEHYKAIEQDKVYLARDDVEKPWADVATIEATIEGGSLWRHGIVHFYAPHKCGLTFWWTVDLEPERANGTSSLQYDMRKVRDIVDRLPAKARADFVGQLQKAAEAMGAQAKDFQDTADRLLRTRVELRALATKGGPR